MRDIKFRAWSEPLKKMDYSPLNAITFDGKVFFGNADITGFHNEIMQFTGLKDKNGKEIYEGDIVRVFGNTTNPRTKELIPYNVVAIVKYEDAIGCFLYRVNGSNVASNFRYTKADGLSYEIIGNIHENPELLGVQE